MDSRGVAEATTTNVDVARASNVSIGIGVGVKNVGDGEATIGVCEARGVTVVWFGKLQAAVTSTHNTKTISKR